MSVDVLGKTPYDERAEIQTQNLIANWERVRNDKGHPLLKSVYLT
jgi:hypothetical protein